MNIQEIKSIVMSELPKIIRTDDEVRRFILKIGREEFLDQSEANRRFDRMMDQLADERKRSDEKWHAWEKKWDETQRKSDEKWRENQLKWQAWEKKWDENQRKSDEKWQAWEKKWDENQRKSDERWRENQLEIKKLYRKYDSTIGALGARWGIYSEESFRNGLKGILEEAFDVEVININEFDDEGYVFGRPDQVELDIIIRDGTLIICEIKSSIDKAGMYIFERKVRFYEKRHQRQASRMIVISPMVDKRARVVAENLGIHVYTHAEDVEGL